MSNIQRRAKNTSKVPLIDMTDNKIDIPMTDPRSPSANVTRYSLKIIIFCINI